MEIPIRLAAMMALLVTVTAHPHRRHCHMSRYRSVSPSDIRAVRRLHNEHEKSPFSDGIKCYRKMLRQKPSVCDLQASDRLILTLERVTLAVDVLTNMTESPLAKLLSLPLTMLLSLEDDLKICRKSPLYSDPPSEQLMPWLHHLKHFREKVSSECVQDAVLLSLTQLLIEDIMCWANNE
ncbi:interleukin 28B (interferon, lambda 3), gene 1 precursor [Xenopus tropicalis]|uniref:Interferon lambda1 n=1 Tax=Xenopus tropicalis TaxID=8364 RepID=D2DJP5_XENTR|nr:interleukin 28B (interferon, lambda 3), gene 1 precursor [Xenopus tropicalis]ACV32134.1 interferon lambda1 [Xenopus tropicalis]ANQ43304.1 type III interferon 6 [Xenopus tropicalis]|eukprot:NP_001165234.1 interleukin 28B (interferon, lambda 3), gene 1 precursor [Xenopus tropicalis]